MNDYSAAHVLRTTLCYLHVCVPVRWTDNEVELFANQASPTGVSPWKVTTTKNKDGTDALRYVRCESFPGKSKHVVLVC